MGRRRHKPRRIFRRDRDPSAGGPRGPGPGGRGRTPRRSTPGRPTTRPSTAGRSGWPGRCSRPSARRPGRASPRPEPATRPGCTRPRASPIDTRMAGAGPCGDNSMMPGCSRRCCISNRGTPPPGVHPSTRVHAWPVGVLMVGGGCRARERGLQAAAGLARIFRRVPGGVLTHVRSEHGKTWS